MRLLRQFLRALGIARRQSLGLFERPMQFHLSAQNRKQPLIFPRFLDKIARTPPHGFDRELNVTPRRHDNHRQGAVLRDNFREQIQAFPPGSCVAGVIQVHQHRVILSAPQGVAHQVRRAHHVHLVALGFEQKFDGIQDMLLIVGGENAGSILGF